MILPIVAYGTSVLREETEEIDKDYPDLDILIEDMFETMHNADGIGLAAPQIGISKRIFVVDGTSLDNEEMKNFKKVFINPKLVNESGKSWGFDEGCLSIPGIREEVKRKSDIEVSYFDENWNERKEYFSGMQARVIQHEYDHIEGKLFIDYLSALKRKLIKNKLLEITKGNCDVNYNVE